MTTCFHCGGTEQLPTKGPWWMGRYNAQLFNVVQCKSCLRYINGRTGRPVLPLFCCIIVSQLGGVLLCMALGCVGLSLGGRTELWFGIPFVVLLCASFVMVFWVARTHH
jgi:hypothetical protein